FTAENRFTTRVPSPVSNGNQLPHRDFVKRRKGQDEESFVLIDSDNHIRCYVQSELNGTSNVD
ncbi:MAG TPA: hypothetical protein VLR10_01505, partial [Nitrososphaeraceae archaeon]|nr:hypothetical protein [Nitrososphaeraceae archaeon]